MFGYVTIKVIFDKLAALLVLIFTLPIMLIVAFAVMMFLGTPILFAQQRPGKDEKIFKLYKFRTMRDARDASGNLLSDEQRLTRFGKLLRSTSLDELPSLVNVLKGELSFVGPRPLLVEYLPLYSAEQKRRHNVMPGITGLAQVRGRNSLSWDEKFSFDLYYVDNQSLWLDLKIIMLTLIKVIQRDGISAEGQVTAERFDSLNRPK